MNQPASKPAESIYKIIPAALWVQAQGQGTVPLMPIDKTDGYMHFSTENQLIETLSLHFKSQSDLRVLTVPTELVGKDLKWEPSRGGQLFPHLYAPLPTHAVRAIRTASVDSDGNVDLVDGP